VPLYVSLDYDIALAGSLGTHAFMPTSSLFTGASMTDVSERYGRFEWLLFDRPAPHVLRMTLNNPTQMNAMTRGMKEEIHSVWREIDNDPETRVTIVTGSGRAFCAGGAFDAMPDTSRGERNARFCYDFNDARELVTELVNTRKPIVSAINGPAIGAGLAVALLADISIAGRTARLLDGHLRIGVTPGDHALIIWPLLCGLAKAKYLLMGNVTVSGEEAAAMNLISLAVDDDQLQAKALAVAEGLARTAPTALRMTKYLLNSFLRRNQDIFDLSAAFEMVNFGSDENVEALRAYTAKDTPRFGIGSSEFK